MSKNERRRLSSRRGTAVRGAFVITALAIVGSVVVIVPAARAKADAQASPTAKPKTPFIVNRANAPAQLDPPETSVDGFTSNFYVTLLQYGTKEGSNGFSEVDFRKLLPYLATQWRVQDGGKTYVFTLRRGAKFADGSPMDAGAVKYSFDRVLTRGGIGASILNGNLGVGKLLASVEAPNATTVIIRLKQRYPAYPEILTLQNFGIVNPRLVEAHGGVEVGKPNEWMASHVAGGGPYLLKEYDPGRRAVLVTNPRFFGPKPRESRVIVNFIPSDATLLFQASAGKADVTVGLTGQSAASLRRNSCCQIVANDYDRQAFLSLPNLQPPFNNRTFREALSYAVPYAGLVKSVLFGYGKSFYGPFPPGNTNYNATIGKARTFDMAKAKRLVQQSGVTVPVDLDLVVQQGLNDFAQVATIVKDTWRQLGVNVNIKALAPSTYIGSVWTRPELKITYSVIAQFGGTFGFSYWVTNYDARCGHLFNTSNYCNPAVSDLIDPAFYAPPSKQQALWDQLARLWVKDAPRIPLYAPQYVVVLKQGVRHYDFRQADLHIWKWGR